jgi:hypothetical protein
MLDPTRQHVSVQRAELVRDSGDNECLHPAEDDPELLVLVTVERHGRARLELDQVEHRPFAEQGPTADAGRELERADVVEADELRLRGGHWRIISLRRR